MTPKAGNEGQFAVHVVVVTHNAAQWIDEFFLGIENSSYPLRVIMVDNASTDRTIGSVPARLSVRVLRQDTNVGFGRANNIGIACALSEGADYILLLNQDVCLAVSSVEQLVSSATRQPEYGLLSPLHLNGTGSDLDHLFKGYAKECLTQIYFDCRFGTLKSVYPIEFVNAAAWLIKNEVLHRVGGFDPLFFMYGEDNDLIQRLNHHGVRVGLVPSSHVYHHRRISIKEPRRVTLTSSRMVASMTVLLKNPGRPFRLNLAHWARYVMRSVIYVVLQGDMWVLGNLVRAVFVLALKIRTIYNHYNICRQRGPHFLDEETDSKPIYETSET